jgi:hypothetical protein
LREPERERVGSSVSQLREKTLVESIMTTENSFILLYILLHPE